MATNQTVRAKRLHFERDVDFKGFWLILDGDWDTAVFIPEEILDSLKESVDVIAAHHKKLMDMRRQG